jgi:hypothetical protein
MQQAKPRKCSRDQTPASCAAEASIYDLGNQCRDDENEK